MPKFDFEFKPKKKYPETFGIGSRRPEALEMGEEIRKIAKEHKTSITEVALKLLAVGLEEYKKQKGGE